MNDMDQKLPEAEITTTAEEVNVHNLSCTQLLQTLREIVESGDMNRHREVASLKTAFYNRRNREQLDELSEYVAQGNAPETFTAPASEEETAFRDLLAKFKEGRSAYLEAEEERQRQNLEKKQAIIEQLKLIAEDIDNVNVNFQKFHQLQQDFREKADVPPTAESELWKTYQAVVEEFYDRLKMNKELRDLDFKKNLELKKALIAEAQALTGKEDVIEAVRQLQALHNQWREIGPVAKEIRAEIWDEFKQASTTINKRHQEHFEARKEAEQAAEALKTELCAEAEAVQVAGLTSFADWDEATRKMLDLQARWKEAGMASHKANNQLFARFRGICDAFFEAKSSFYKQSRAAHNENYAKKIELCERAEALASEQNLKSAAEQAAALQAEWKTIGSVGRKMSDEIWKRFTTACNAVFERRHNFINDRRKEELANQEAKQALIDRLSALDQEGDARENLKVVKEAQAEWNTIGHVPLKIKESLWQEFRALCDIFYAADRTRNERNRENRFRERASQMRAAAPQKMGSEQERLMRDLDRKKAELKTYENNLGFFNVKSSAGNSMVKDMERRIERIREEIAEINKRIKILREEVKKEETKQEA